MSTQPKSPLTSAASSGVSSWAAADTQPWAVLNSSGPGYTGPSEQSRSILSATPFQVSRVSPANCLCRWWCAHEPAATPQPPADRSFVLGLPFQYAPVMKSRVGRREA